MPKLDLEKLLNGCETHTTLTYGAASETDEDGLILPSRVCAIFAFSEQGFGFGEITVVLADGEMFIDGETMARETITRILTRVATGAILDTDDDPEKHRKYNAAMARRCSEHCAICFPTTPKG